MCLSDWAIQLQQPLASVPKWSSENTKMGNNQLKQGQCAPNGRQQALTIEMLLDLPGIEWLIARTKKMGILSLSSPNNQPVQSINKCVNQLLCDLIQRGLLSPSLPNNQPIQSINKFVDWLLLDSNTKGTPFSLLYKQNQPVMSINNCVDWPCLDSKGDPLPFLSQQSTGNVNQQMCWLTTSWLNTKVTSFSFLLQQSTVMSINNNP